MYTVWPFEEASGPSRFSFCSPISLQISSIMISVCPLLSISYEQCKHIGYQSGICQDENGLGYRVTHARKYPIPYLSLKQRGTCLYWNPDIGDW